MASCIFRAIHFVASWPSLVMNDTESLLHSKNTEQQLLQG